LGKGSYFESAPRIKNWDEFKMKIIEFERAEPAIKELNFNEDFKKVMNSFINYIKKENQ